MIEQINHKSLNLHSIQVRKQSLDVLNQESNNEIFVARGRMRCGTWLIEWTLNDVSFNDLE